MRANGDLRRILLAIAAVFPVAAAGRHARSSLPGSGGKPEPPAAVLVRAAKPPEPVRAGPASPGRPGRPSLALSAVPALRVVDGDTLLVEVAGDRERVRLLGVDAPESVHPRRPVEPWGREAAEFVRARAGGRVVGLELEGRRRDRYGRLLAYVWLEDGAMLNLELVERGLARRERRFGPGRHALPLEEAERRARAERRGLWGGQENRLFTPETQRTQRTQRTTFFRMFPEMLSP